MNKNAYNLLISKLISYDYEIYLSIYSDNTIVIRHNNKLEICLCLSTYNRGNGSKYVKLSKTQDNKEVTYKPSSFNSILVVDLETRVIWKIPFNDIVSCKFLSLGKRWSSYLLTYVSNDINTDTVIDLKKQELAKRISNRAIRTKHLIQKDLDDIEKITELFSIGNKAIK